MTTFPARASHWPDHFRIENARESVAIVHAGQPSQADSRVEMCSR